MFGDKPKETRTPLVAADHPETDLSEFCDQDKNQTVPNNFWVINLLAGLGRFDTAVHVMSMSWFRHQPRAGHLKGSTGSLVILPTSLMDL